MRRTLETRLARIVIGHLRTVRGALLLALLCAVASAGTALLAPWPLKLIFDHILLGQPLAPSLSFLAGLLHGASLAGLVALSLSMVLIALLAGVFAYFNLFLTSRVGSQLVYTLRSALVDHLQRLSLAFHSRARSGELLRQVTSETNMLREVFARNAITLVTHAFTVAGMFVVMFLMDWQLSLIVLVCFPVVLLPLFLIMRKLRKSARRQRRKEGQLASRVSEMLGTLAVAQAFGRERDQLQRFDTESALSMEESIRTARIQAAGARMAEIVTAGGTCIVVLFGGMQVLQGRMSPGMLLVFSAYVVSLYRPVKAMARLSARAARASAAIERLSEILEMKPEIEDDPDAIEAYGLRGDIIFDNVSFAYEPGKPVLRNVSFRIPAGMRVALVGGSGAGKSTVINLILRLYDPSEGRVMIDGVDVRRYRRASLRHEIGVVLQDNMLLRASVRENIAYGKPDATQEEIEEAARQAHAHDFIMCLPEGYDEVVGERGCTLSGGERQRIALARALIKKSSILIMDEPTSAVDADAEALIRERMSQLQRDKTMLIIAHQLYSVQDADWILVLQEGRIVESGPHAELIRRGGHYCDLFRLRAGKLAA